jgi:hypothetical protein
MLRRFLDDAPEDRREAIRGRADLEPWITILEADDGQDRERNSTGGGGPKGGES